MTHLVALLRAVNVGGTGKLPMETLREICRAAGFADPRTYIQSGNVVFGTDRPPQEARAELEARLAADCGQPVGVLIRDGAQMRRLLAENPFPEAAPNRVAVLFLDRPPEPDIAATAKGRADEVIVPGDCAVYIHYPSGMGRSRLRLAAMAEGTARNLNTVAKLAAMLPAQG